MLRSADLPLLLLLSALPACAAEELTSPDLPVDDGTSVAGAEAPMPPPEDGPGKDTRLSPRFVFERADQVSWMYSLGPFGEYSQTHFCEPGSWVRGFAQRVESDQHGGDDTALNSIALYCYKKDGQFVEAINPQKGLWGSWNDRVIKCPGADNFMKGFQLRMEWWQGSGDDTAANDFEIACRNGGTLSAPNGMNWGEDGDWLHCAAGSAVCGISVQFEESLGSGDDSALNGVSIYCCDL